MMKKKMGIHFVVRGKAGDWRCLLWRRGRCQGLVGAEDRNGVMLIDVDIPCSPSLVEGRSYTQPVCST